MTTATNKSLNLLLGGLREIIQPARLLTKKHFPTAQALGDNWQRECFGAMLAVEQKVSSTIAFVELSSLPGNPEDWKGYLRGKLQAVRGPGVETSMSVRDATAALPIYGGGFREELVRCGYASDWFDQSIGNSALTGGFETWDQATLAVGFLRSFGSSNALLSALHWDAPGLAACATEEGLTRATYQKFMQDMMNLTGI